MTVFLSLHEFPSDDDDRYSTVGLLIRSKEMHKKAALSQGNRATEMKNDDRTSSTTAASNKDGGQNEESEEEEEEEDEEEDYGGRQVVGRLRVRRDAFDHLGSQHADELWRSAEELLERSAVTDARRRRARRRRDLDYWHQLTTLLEQLDHIDRSKVRLQHTTLKYDCRWTWVGFTRGSGWIGHFMGWVKSATLTLVTGVHLPQIRTQTPPFGLAYMGPIHLLNFIDHACICSTRTL